VAHPVRMRVTTSRGSGQTPGRSISPGLSAKANRSLGGCKRASTPSLLPRASILHQPSRAAAPHSNHAGRCARPRDQPAAAESTSPPECRKRAAERPAGGFGRSRNPCRGGAFQTPCRSPGFAASPSCGESRPARTGSSCGPPPPHRRSPAPIREPCASPPDDRSRCICSFPGTDPHLQPPKYSSPCTWGRTLSPCLKKSTCANDSSHPCAQRHSPLLSTILSQHHLIVDFATILTSGPNRRQSRPQNKIYRNIVRIQYLIFTFSCWHGHCLREGTRRKHSPLTNADNGPEQSGNHTLI
jgi:hypothetical protein